MSSPTCRSLPFSLISSENSHPFSENSTWTSPAGSPPATFLMDENLGEQSSGTELNIPLVFGDAGKSNNIRIPHSRERSAFREPPEPSTASSFGSHPRSSLKSLGSLDRSREEMLLSSSYLSDNNGEEPITKIVITGGACAGKTTAIARLRGYLLDNGMRVFTVPDSATVLFENGASFEDLGSSRSKIEFRAQVLRMQVQLEHTFEELARSTRVPSVILCDRGLMDGQCYLSDEEWRAVLEKQHLSVVEARDQQYSAVFHLMTAADGAETFYQDNSQRFNSGEPYSTIEEARDFDLRCQAAWCGHPRFTVIANRPGQDFEGKLNDLVCGVAQHVGIQVPREKKFRKFELRQEPRVEDFPEDIPVEHFEVEKVYLCASSNDKGIYSFVRRRSQGSHASYTRTSCVASEGQTIEMKKIISATEYGENVTERADPSRRTVRQHRMTFLYEQTHYEIYVYKKPCRGLSLLRVQVFANDANPIMPPFLDLGQEVTAQDHFSAYQLSIQHPGASMSSPRTAPLPPWSLGAVSGARIASPYEWGEDSFAL